jgi:hypothetical protein
MESGVQPRAGTGARWALGIFLALDLVAIAGVAITNPGLVRFWPFTSGEFLQLITPLFLVSLFIERALEVLLTPWRAEGSERLQGDLRAASKADGPLKAATAQKLIAHRSTTQRIAFAGGVTLGVVFAALGIRALGLFVDPAVFKALPAVQKKLFTVADVLLTGAVLGGGSDGLHKLISVFTTFLDTTAARTKARAPEE